MRISYQDMVSEFTRVLQKYGFSEQDAELAAKIFADNSLCGIYSHGLNRFPIFIEVLKKGNISPEKKPVCIMQAGCMERWDGQRGFGPLGAQKAMDRACELAEEYGIGLVAVGNINHWMRGGTYGWQAAERGYIGICWSNTFPNMPAWGALDRRIGNNPLVISIPRKSGDHVLLDVAMTQYSYGKVEQTRLKGEMLPYHGGFDGSGMLTADPAAIEATGRFLPIGLWKGSGLSIVLDLMSVVLSSGNSVKDIGGFGEEIGLTQIMIAIDPKRLNAAENEDMERRITEILDNVNASEPAETGNDVTWPGQRMIRTRQENLEKGIPVIEEKWNTVLEL